MTITGGSGLNIAVALPRGPPTEDVADLDEPTVVFEKMEESLRFELPSGDFGTVIDEGMR